MPRYLPKEPGHVCGECSAHHSFWGNCVSMDPRGSAHQDWMEAHSKLLLNDGSPTRIASYDQSAGIFTPHVSLVDTLLADRFTWKTIPELGSAHLPLLPILGVDIKLERDHTRRRTNYPKANWLLFHKSLENGIHSVSSVGSLTKRLEAFCSLRKRSRQRPSASKRSAKGRSPG